MIFHEKLVSFDEDHHGGKQDTLIIKHSQVIPGEFLDQLAERKKAYTDTSFRAGEFEEFACIPTVIVEKWLREGFDIYKENANAIVARLKREDLGAFLTGRE